MKRARHEARGSVVGVIGVLAAIVPLILTTSRRSNHCASGALRRAAAHCSPTGGVVLCLLVAVAGCGGGGSGGGDGSGGTTPPPPTNQSPANARLIEASSPTVGQLSASWLPARDDSTPPASLRYQLHASTELGFSPTASTLRLETTGQLSGLVTSGLEPGQRYYVRLTVVDAQGASATSETLSVTVADTPASQVPGTTVRVLEGTQVAAITENSIRLAAGVPAPLVGTYLASGDGAGYLRRITGVSTLGDQQVLATERAALSEVVGDFQVSSVVRMAALPVSATSGLREKARASGASGVQGRATFTWPDSGFTYSAGADQAPVGAREKVSTQARMDSSSLRFEIGPTSTSTGDWANLLGPSRIGLEEGGSGEALLWAETTSDKDPRFGEQVSICKFEFGSITSEAPGATPRDVSVKLSGPMERTTVIPFPEGDRVTKARQAFEITALAGTASGYPYKVNAYLYVEDNDRNCIPPKPGELLTRPFGGWREIIALEVTIYVGNDAFPSNEKIVKEFEGKVDATAGADARFTVTNDVVVNFDPLVSYDIRLGPVGKGLEHVRIAVEASPMVEQTLTVAADAKGTIDAEAPLISPRKFYKLFIAAGGVPVVVSGEFTLRAKVSGNVTGALQATEKLQIGFERLAYGVECSGFMDCRPIEERRPVVNLRVGGEGTATADLTITLVPSLTVSLYESVNGRITLDPYLRADAGLEGKVELDTAIDPEDGLPDRAFDADYRLTTASLKAGMNAYVYGDFTVLDRTWAAWPDGAKEDDFSTHRVLPLAEAVVAALPQLNAAVDMAALHPADIAAIRIAADARNWPNPWAAIFPGAPETLVTWRRWTSPKIKAPLGTPSESYGFLEPASIDADEVWVVFDEPGTYVVRLGGFSSWGTWARQYVDVAVTVADDNGNGILDHVESRKGGAAIAIDSVGCTVPIVGSVMVCIINGSNLPDTIEFFATNCLPARMEALPDAFEESRRYGCTPVVAGVPVEVGYSVPGFAGMAPSILALAAVDSPPAVAAEPSQLAAGYQFTLGLDAEGTAWAWGLGPLGDIRECSSGFCTSRSKVPVRVDWPHKAIAIAAGEYHAIALRSDGTVWTWGDNFNGQLGNGTTTDSASPTQVPGLDGIVDVAAGRDNSFALKADRTLWAWGAGGLGRLGTGTGKGSRVPVRVVGLEDVTDFGAGYTHGVALRADGSVWAWGWNFDKQLGSGVSSYRGSDVPVSVPGLVGVSKLAVGHEFTLALNADGTVQAWGDNGDGQLGNGTTVDTAEALQIPGLVDVTDVAAGYDHALAISGGNVWAWGSNFHGQLGNNSRSDSTAPVQVIGLTDVVAIAAGSRFSVALRADGSVWAWGYGLRGQLGVNSSSSSSVPVQVLGPTGAGFLNLAAP